MHFDLTTLPDDFSRTLYTGSFEVLSNDKNPVRLHLFAAGFRELFTHILHVYAPDEEVRACSWFEQADDTPSVTRRQRVRYAAQGGLTDDYIEELGLDISRLHDAAIKAIDALSKATHVKPASIVTDKNEINEFVDRVVCALSGLMASFAKCRNAVIEALGEHIYFHVEESFITKTFDQINTLAGKGYEVDDFLLDPEISVVSIGSSELSVKFTGVAPVSLHYGKGDDAATVRHDFPFWMVFTAPTRNPSELEYSSSYFDDSGWYQ